MRDSANFFIPFFNLDKINKKIYKRFSKILHKINKLNENGLMKYLAMVKWLFFSVYYIIKLKLNVRKSIELKNK